MEERLVTLSRTLAYVLRHHPENVGLRLDEEGWVSVEALLAVLRQQTFWQGVSVEDLEAVIAQSEKKRYQMQNGMIRATYGHSLPKKMQYQSAPPPIHLFHGTTPEATRRIREEGLKPMQRQYVHLSAEEGIARTVALRRTSHPVILRVNALEAHEQGIAFYSRNDLIWLSDPLPPHFIQFPLPERKSDKEN